MKKLLIIFLLIPWILMSQECENIIYSDNEIVNIRPNAYVLNCDSIGFDTTYHVIPFEGTKYVKCFKLFHKNEEWLIAERWNSNDTTYSIEYFRNGKIKKLDEAVHQSSSMLPVSHRMKMYHPNGTLKADNTFLPTELNESRYYYDNGSIRSIFYNYAGSNYNEGKVFYRNGSLARYIEYTPFDSSYLNSQNYRKTEILSETFFSLDGDTIQTNPFDEWNIDVLNYPMLDTTVYPIHPDLYSFYHIRDQSGYDESMSALKEEIRSRITYPKNFECPIFYTHIELIVKKDGSIDLLNISGSNEIVKSSIKESIESISKWQVGKVDGEAVNVHVYTDLLIDKR